MAVVRLIVHVLVISEYREGKFTVCLSAQDRKVYVFPLGRVRVIVWFNFERSKGKCTVNL